MWGKQSQYDGKVEHYSGVIFKNLNSQTTCNIGHFLITFVCMPRREQYKWIRREDHVSL